MFMRGAQCMVLCITVQIVQLSMDLILSHGYFRVSLYVFFSVVKDHIIIFISMIYLL